MKSARTESSDELSLGEGITRRAWKHKGTHTRAHTHHTRAHPSKGVLLLFLERPGFTGMAANETLPDSRHGTLRWSRTRTELFPRLLPLTLCCGSRLRSTGVRRHCRSRADVARPWSPKTFGDGCCYTTSAAGTPCLTEMGRGGRGPLSAGRGSLLQLTQGNVH